MQDNRIKVTNTAIIIDNYELHESEQLEHPFQIYDPVYHRMNYLGFYYDKENKRIYLPGGLDLWWVRKAINEKYYTRIDPYPYKKISNIRMKYKPRDNEQLETLKFTAGLEEYDGNQYAPQLSINLSTGKGKTYCSIATIAFYQIKSIIITGSNSLLTQWEQNIIEYTNLNSSDIFRINGSDICNMILNGSSNKAENASIFLCSHGTLRSFGDRYGWDKVGELFKKLGIGMKFYDECHTNYDNMLMIDFFTNVFKTFYVTATPGRSDWKENHIFQISLKNVPNIDLFDENKDPHTSYIALKWNSNPTAMDISRCKSSMYGLDRNKYMEYLTKKPEFYELLRVIMDLVIKCKGRALFYIGTNDGILRVYYWICQNYPEFIGDIGIFTSLVSKEDKMKEKKKRLLLSTTKSAGLGEHIEGLKLTVVLAEPFKSDIVFRQTLGRTRDPNTIYIETVDLGFKYTKKYYYAKLPTANKYAKDVSDMTIDKYELKKRSDNLRIERTHWQQSPIELCDDRFDFDSVVPEYIKNDDKQIPGVPFCPIKFIENDINSPNGFRRY